MDYYNLNAIVPPIMAPIINTMELAAFIQSTTDKYFSIIDLANMFCLVCFKCFSARFPSPSKGNDTPLPGYP